MRLSTITTGGKLHPALWLDDELLDLVAANDELATLSTAISSVRGFFKSGSAAMSELRKLEDHIRSSVPVADRLREAGALHHADKTALAPAIPDPGLILAAGLNYRAHLEEMNTPIPAAPYAFTKNASSLVGSGQAIVLPEGHDAMVDWEGEFSAVIGRTCFDVSVERALEYVGGYTIINDVSARDWAAAVFASVGIMGPITAWEANLLGKQFPTFCPLGPTIVTADEISDPRDVRLRTRLNGEIMQDAHTADLVFGVAELISHYSHFYRLRPGDVITTGSPAGVGFGRTPKLFMKPGDIIEVEVGKVGILRNPISAAAASR